MFYRNKKTRKYQAPVALATHMALESNFCQTVRFNVQVRELEATFDEEEESYFES